MSIETGGGDEADHKNNKSDRPRSNKPPDHLLHRQLHLFTTAFCVNGVIEGIRSIGISDAKGIDGDYLPGTAIL